jgi:hypothetical protein
MIHPLRKFMSKHQTATHYVESGLDFFEKGKERWYMPRLTPPPVTGICSAHGIESCACQANQNDHLVGYTDDVLTTEVDAVIVAIIPSSRPDTGYVAIIQTKLVHSARTWFQNDGYLSDDPYVSFHKVLKIDQCNGGLANCMSLLRRSDNHQPIWPTMHILLDDAGLGSLESGPFKALASEVEGRMIPLSILFQKQYKIVEPGSKELLSVGAAVMLSDLRSVVSQKRLTVPEHIAKSALGKVALAQMQSNTVRGGEGSLSLAGRTRGEYEPDKYGLLYAIGLAVSYAEISGFRMIGCRLG